MPVYNPRFPHTCKIIRKISDDPMSDVLYNGSCRSYDKNTTTMSGEVITANKGLSLPKTLRDWTRDRMPKEGDRVEVDFGPYTERGMVIDRAAANFGGTHLIWRNVKD